MENSTSIVVGGEVKTVGIQACGKLFVFNPSQINFILNLQKLKNVHAASLSVGKDEEWAKKFLSSKKFKSFVTNKLQEFSVRSGLTVEWWHQFGKQIADGYKETYKITCDYCKYESEVPEYEIESQRTDDLEIDARCPACQNPAKAEKQREEFKPTREQVEAWKELGNRISPKIERVHHQFTSEEIIFESEEQK